MGGGGASRLRSEAAAAAWAAPTRASLPCCLLPQAPPPCRLYALYLIDSIAKNVGGPYPPLLGAGLASAFAAAWASHPPSRPALGRLLATWDGVFDAGVLQDVRAWLAAAVDAEARAVAARAAAEASAAAAAARAAAPPPPYYAAGAPPAPYYGQAAAPPPAFAPPAGPPHYPPHAPPAPYYSAPQPPRYAYGAPEPAPYPPPHASPSLAAPLPAVLSSLAAAGLISIPPARRSASPDGKARPRRARRGGAKGGGGEGGGLSPFRAAPSPWRGDDTPGGVAAPSHAPASSPHYPPSSDPYVGALSARPGPSPPGATAAPPTPPAVDAAARASLAPARVRGDYREALAALEAATAESRPRLLEAAALRRRRADARAAGRGASRAWYVDAAAWIAGTAASADAAPAFFSDGGSSALAPPPRPPPRPTEPADDAQRACALTGEPFDSYYDDVKGEWRYRDARRLRGADAEAVGLPDGALVKASAVEGSGATVTAALTAVALDAELVAAAAEAGGDGGGDGDAGPRVKRIKSEPGDGG